MAHPCFLCGGECYCNGDWDDVIVSHTPANCEGCGCEEFAEDQGWNDDDFQDNGLLLYDDEDLGIPAKPEHFQDDDEKEYFVMCDDCDGHPACEDFGCAIEHGLGHLVQPPL